MSDRTFLRWGGICTFASMIVFVALLVVSQIQGGLEWPLWTAVFSVFICLYTVVLFAGYDFVATSHYALARSGFAFGLLLIVVLFVEVAAWGGDRMLINSGSTPAGTELSPLLALFNSTHTLAIWFHGLWMALWGTALVRLPGKSRASGALMLLFAVFYSFYYLLLRLGEPELGEMAHSAGHVAMVLSHVLFGLLLMEASKSSTPAVSDT